MKDGVGSSASDECGVVIDHLARSVRVLHALGRISNARATILEVDRDGQCVVVYEDAERAGDPLRARMVLLCLWQQKKHAASKQDGVWAKAHEAAERFGVPISAVCCSGDGEGDSARWYFARDSGAFDQALHLLHSLTRFMSDDERERLGPISFTVNQPSLPEVLLYLLDSTASSSISSSNRPSSTPPTTKVSLGASLKALAVTANHVSFASSGDAPPSQLAPAFDPSPTRSPRKRRRSPQPAIPDSLFSPSPRKKPRLSQAKTPRERESSPLFAHAAHEESPLFTRTRKGLDALVLGSPRALEDSPIFTGERARSTQPMNTRRTRPVRDEDSPLFARAPAQSSGPRMLGPATPTPSPRGRPKRTRTKSDEMEGVSPVRPAKRAKVVASEAVTVSPRRSTRRTRPPVIPATPVRPAPLVLRTRSANNLFAKPEEDPMSNPKPPRVIQTRSRTPAPIEKETEDEDDTMSEAASSDDEDDADLPPESSPIRPQRRTGNLTNRGRSMLRAVSPASSIASSMSRESTPGALPVPNAFGLDETPCVPTPIAAKRVDLLDVAVPRVARVAEHSGVDVNRLDGRWVDVVAGEVAVLVRRGMRKGGGGR